MKTLLLFGTGVLLLFVFAGSDVVAQNGVTVVPEGTTISISPTESKMQTITVQPVHTQQTLPTLNSEREDEIHVQIRAKKTELENSADNARKTTLNDEIQQLQDELKIIQNPPVQIHKDPVLPDLN